jgi:alkylation response protein AidB-like acyl-CoA dehydrogenase
MARRRWEVVMEIAYTPEHEAFRAELREYFDNLLNDDVVEELAGEHGFGAAHRRVWKQMCADGWVGMGWPKEWGGQGRTAIEQFVFFDESVRAGAPVPTLTLNTVGPTVMNYGTQEQRDFFIPKILKGDLHFAIGYSEPGAGTDLAALSTRAVRDGDEYVINGQKTWTSLAIDADYIWLAVRTNAEVKKHKGISMLLVPMDTPGITIQPLHLTHDHDINHVFFDDVRVPVSTRVGGENEGWGLITNQLNHERVTLCASGSLERTLSEVTQWAKDTLLPDGRRVIDQEWVQLNLARLHARIDALRLMNWRVAWEATEGKLSVGHCSAIKVYGTELNIEAFRLLMDVIGPTSILPKGSPGAVLKARLEQMSRGSIILTFGGGVNEVQRDLISMFELGFPRASR